jgi:hypothetical protein
MCVGIQLLCLTLSYVQDRNSRVRNQIVFKPNVTPDVFSQVKIIIITKKHKKWVAIPTSHPKSSVSSGRICSSNRTHT